ncbi:FAD:protein FMN transferase [Pleomorphomonas sp. JP5]|uniref:FAD:protein FMN transferase n=1 Tax=Pleomorphomonas sp. JP5 TaxID=2942998 RepID=UPI002042D264|nr:FAD:protein FMN transferase [Pleomorphomonas sp. JP5]MCM5557857.1 FAD:protein FMN transferase [Pleomorphomonas sp. JP5]
MADFLARPVERRRFIRIGATLAVMAVVPSALAVAPVRRWSGNALGAHASIELVGADAPLAAATFAAVEQEIARLEGLFSLYRPDSALSRLNAIGHLETPEADFLRLLGLARSVYRETGGLFDPTVQPLFAAYAAHYAGGRSDALPTAELAERLALVGFAQVAFDENVVRFSRPGMAMTLNGIAQGYVTDRVADLLKARGFDNVLLDIGEIRALGGGSDGDGWKVGLAAGPDGEALSASLRLRDRAVATSMMAGTVLDAPGRVGHILHPRKGAVPSAFSSVSIVAAEAALADALSTAAVLMTPDELSRLDHPGVEIYATPV